MRHDTHSSSWENKEDRRRLRQCNYIILRHSGVSVQMSQRARDFTPYHIALIIKNCGSK